MKTTDRLMQQLRILILVTVAMLAFAGNSLG